MENYRILSLDGGGSWSLIQVKCLRQLFKDRFGNDDPTGHEVLGYFDLVACNSGGSLVAAAMAENYRLSEIEAIFHSEEIRRSIFSRLSFWEKGPVNALIRLLKIGPQYSTSRKLPALEKLLPNLSKIQLHKLPAYIGQKHTTHFLVVGYDYYRNRAEMFRSNLESRALSSVIERRISNGSVLNSVPDKLTLSQAIHVSSTAPINFFDKPASIEIGGYERYFWDGAVTGHNNPVLIAIIEALCNGHNSKNIQLVSIGSGATLLPTYSKLNFKYVELRDEMKKSNLKNDIRKSALSILNDPPDFATFSAYAILYPELPVKSENFIRLNPVLRPRLINANGIPTWDLPQGLDIDEFLLLKNLSLDAIKNSELASIEKFCNGWIEGNLPNQAIRHDAALECVLGHETYKQGIEDFKKWDMVIA